MWAVFAVPPDEADLMTKNLPLVTDINYHRSFFRSFLQSELGILYNSV